MERSRRLFVFSVLLVVVLASAEDGSTSQTEERRKIMGAHPHTGNLRKIMGIRFLLTVNDTWKDPPGCIATIATPFIAPNLSLSKSHHLAVGDCDNGPLQYRVMSPGKDNNKYTVSLIFHSSVIVDASPPTCELSWNGTYLTPKKENEDKPNLLPSCFTMDSREGYHMTYYWFNILEWEFA